MVAMTTHKRTNAHTHRMENRERRRPRADELENGNGNRTVDELRMRLDKIMKIFYIGNGGGKNWDIRNEILFYAQLTIGPGRKSNGIRANDAVTQPKQPANKYNSDMEKQWRTAGRV